MSAYATEPTEILARIDDQQAVSLERLFALLRIPSISANKKFDPDCRRAAELVRGMILELGVDTVVEETAGQPVVFGQKLIPGKPHVVVYGHYDVQPIEPLNKWHGAEDTKVETYEPGAVHPAFEPRFDDPDAPTRVIARGASDDKGQMLTMLEALRAFKDVEGELPLGVTFLIEGGEESGSVGLRDYLRSIEPRVKGASAALVCDTGMWDRDTPWITTSLRGMAYFEVKVTLAKDDLHSGVYGGGVPNPIIVLSKIIADLHDDDRRITLPGFYDGVSEPSPEMREKWARFDAQAVEKMLAPVGVGGPHGERDRLFLEMIQSRPSCDVNGFVAGYAQDGVARTSIAPVARAHISFRLVGDQDPVRIAESFTAFVNERVPDICKVEIVPHVGARAATVPMDIPEVAAARAALHAEWGREPVELGLGGSIPVVGEFKRIFGLDTLLVGFALVDDNMHAPNEKYELNSFHKGTRSWARIFSALAAG